ncbi:MAG: metallophosphatase family protein [Bacteroidales bacterium]|jgi:hypothetical protein|nr:metallophosphatase family protein [Bacteroidales bacterium]MDD2569789.1 metallophosphoesterase family protein [Bacteroidales bacterium]MDD2811944.1 metallophosphoesterase family protein [Bacteroidales bacterium]MDD3385512.1 metallophosphoesterase family protein [Bacteroidales bacterium]MDD3812575.1 metallophosphoesterase family protein [Bacteroidales bacterium]
MVNIGVLSDTHGYLDDAVMRFFENCDEIWHAGDAGSTDVLDTLAAIKPLRGVYGNIDDWDVRRMVPEFLEFTIEEVPVLMTHIGFYSGRYIPEVVRRFRAFQPKLFVCGHSHILKVKYDHDFKLLQVNPGAAGKSGYQQFRTAVRFQINGDRIEELEVLELPLHP